MIFTRNRLKRDISALGAHSTDLQRSKIQDRTNALKRKIEQWSQVQLLYMPSASRIRTTRDSSAGAFEEKAHNINLFLPSELKEHTPDAVCDERLCRFEWELRRGQSFDALDDLRRHLLLRTHLYKFKHINIRGQRANTRASAVIGNVERNVLEAADRYRRARNALKNLHETLGEHDWLEVFPILEQAHIRGMSEGEAGQSEGNRTLSWIWKARGVSATGDVLTDGEQFLLLHDLHGPEMVRQH